MRVHYFIYTVDLSYPQISSFLLVLEFLKKKKKEKVPEIKKLKLGAETAFPGASTIKNFIHLLRLVFSYSSLNLQFADQFFSLKTRIT